MKVYSATEDPDYLERMQTDSMDLIFVETSEYDLMKKNMTREKLSSIRRFIFLKEKEKIESF